MKEPSERVRSATRAAAAVAVLALAAVACGTLLDVDPDVAAPTSPDAASGIDSSTLPGDGSPLPDVVVVPDPPDVQSPDPSDGAPPSPIPFDATADTYNPPGCPEAPDCERVVFVSSLPVTAPNADPPAADAFCTNLAKAAGVHPRIANRNFLAWTSDGMTSPSLRFALGTKAYIRPNGAVIANHWTDLSDGTILRSIFHDERGAVIGLPALIWTGTATNGMVSAPTCLNWTQSDFASTARVGSLGATNGSWTSFDAGEAPCDEELRVYCFEK